MESIKKKKNLKTSLFDMLFVLYIKTPFYIYEKNMLINNS